MTEIINLGNSIVNCFILKQDIGLILIDSGYPGGFKKFKKKFLEKGFKPSDVKFLFLTHCHDDHTGFLKEIMDYIDAPLILHPEAVERLKAGMNPHTHGASYKTMQLYCKMMSGKERCFPKIDAPDRYMVYDGVSQCLEENGFEGKIIALPGHTADSLGIMLSDERLICGDTVMNMAIAKKYIPLVLENLIDLRKSWDYMIKNAKTLITSHGKPISTEKIKKYRHYLDEIEILPIFKNI